MATNWIELTGEDVRKVLAAAVQDETNQNTTAGVAQGDETDLAAANRRNQLVAQSVAEVRGAIRTAGRYPYSVTVAVPPEGEFHALAIAAWRLINSTPGLARSFLAGDGAVTPLERMYNEAREWVWGCGQPKVGGLAQGASFTAPEDPVGVDWATAVSDDNVAVSGIKWGDSLADDDEYASGVTDSGVVVSELSQNMNTQ